MGRYVLTYFCILTVLIVLDGAWLTLVAGPMFRAALGDVLLPSFRPAPAVLFYLLFPVGLMIFAAGMATPWSAILGYGALFGLFAYGTYDLTNYATLRPWTVGIMLPDMAWGAVVSGLSATLGTLLARLLLRVLF